MLSDSEVSIWKTSWDTLQNPSSYSGWQCFAQSGCKDYLTSKPRSLPCNQSWTGSKGRRCAAPHRHLRTQLFSFMRWLGKCLWVSSIISRRRKCLPKVFELTIIGTFWAPYLQWTYRECIVATQYIPFAWELYQSCHLCMLCYFPASLAWTRRQLLLGWLFSFDWVNGFSKVGSTLNWADAFWSPKQYRRSWHLVFLGIRSLKAPHRFSLRACVYRCSCVTRGGLTSALIFLTFYCCISAPLRKGFDDT